MSDAGYTPEPVPGIPLQEPEPPPRIPWWGFQDVGVALLMAIPIMFLVAAFTAIAFYALPLHPSKAIQALVLQFLFWGLWFLFVYTWLRVRFGHSVTLALGWVRPPGGYARSAVAGLATAGVVILAGNVLNPPPSPPLMDLFSDKLSILLVGFFAVTLGPLCEELSFRGFLMPVMMKALGTIGGVIVTALLFASLHGQEYGWSWRHLLLISMAGAAFGWWRHRTGSTTAAAVMHAAYNLIFFLGLLASRKELIR